MGWQSCGHNFNIYNSQFFHNVHEKLWDQHVYLYQPALTKKKNNELVLGQKMKKLKKKKKEPINTECWIYWKEN